jgi:hypothetical protein
MAGAYQAVVMLTIGFATRTRSRAPEGAASTQVVAVVNMGIREPQDLRPVNAINRWWCPGGGSGCARTMVRRGRRRVIGALCSRR